MSDFFKAVGTIVVVVAVLALLVWGSIAGDRSNRAKIDSWTAEHRYRIIEVEKPSFSTGPFWFSDDEDDHYRVEVEDSDHVRKVIWFRFAGFGSMEHKEGK